MIYTVTLNPSIDYVVNVNTLITGITNRTTNEQYFFGGKGLNVSSILAQLNIKSTALGFVAGFTGDAIENGISNENINTNFIKLSTGISRINIKIKAEEETEINCQGPHISNNEIEKLLINLDFIKDGDTLVLAGSVPNTLPDNIYEMILDRIKLKKVRIVVDATKNLLINTLKYKPFLIKPNKQELCELFAEDISSDEKIIFYAKKLQQAGAKNVIVSLGKDGAMLIDEFGMVHKRGVLKGTVLNTVGAGDSMVAGFLAGYDEKHSYSYALKLGSACGNATSFSMGLAKKEDVFSLLKQFE